MPLTQKIQENYDIAQKKMEAWKERNVAVSATKDHLPKDVINRLEEIVMNEVNLLSDFQRLNNQLSVLRGWVDTHGKNNKKGQLATIDMYLEKLNSLISSYEHLPSLIASINDDGTGMEPEQLLEKIGARVQSPEYIQIMDQLGELVVYQTEMNEIYMMHRTELLTSEDYNQARKSSKVMGNSRSEQRREISDFTSMPFQNLLRIAMPIRELNKDAKHFKSTNPDYYIPEQQVPEKNNPKIQHFIDITSEAAERVGEAVEVVDNKIDAIKSAKAEFSKLPAKMKEEKKQGLMLRAILNLNLNSPLQNNTYASVVAPSAYLKTVLTQAYPELFLLDPRNGIKVVAQDPSTYIDIHKAIGIDLLKLHEAAPNKTITLNPEKFDAKILDELYKDTKNPLWLVLKSTKPINETFTAVQKIQSYAELAVVFKEAKDPVAASTLAQAALAVAQEHREDSAAFTAEFGASSTLGKWLISKADRLGMLKGILDRNINSPLQNNEQSGVADPSAHLSAVLIQAYPELFQLDAKGGIKVVARDPSIYTYIHQAIGVNLFTLDSKEVITLDPAKFDAEMLDKLHENQPNPLWLVLKSTKPVDETFTAAQKIKAYAELTVVFKKAKDHVTAYKLAQAALAVVQKNPESRAVFTTEFGADGILGKWLIGKAKKEEKQLVTNHLTLVDQEASKKDVPSIASTTKADSSGLSSQSSQSSQSSPDASSSSEHSDVSDDEGHYVYKDADDAASVDVSVADTGVDIVAEQPAVRVHDDDDTLDALRSTADADGDALRSTADADGDALRSAADADGDALRIVADADGDALRSAADADGDALRSAADADDGDAPRISADADDGDALRIAADTDDDELDSVFDTDDDELDSAFDTDDDEPDSAFDTDDDEPDSAFDTDDDEPDSAFDTDDDEPDNAFDTDDDEPDEGVDSEFGNIISTVAFDPESYKPDPEVAAKNQQRVNQFFSTIPAQKEILYKGVDEYVNTQRIEDLKEFAKLFPKENAEVKDALNKHDPYFFRKKLDAFLQGLPPHPGEGEVTKLRDLLGSKGTILFQLARREERFDKDYINAVVNESLMSSKGPKWATRPVVPLLGPSASGKSFVKKQILEEINNRTTAIRDTITENGLVFSDGGIERDESRVRKLMIAYGVKNSCKDILDLDDGNSGKLKGNILKAATLNPDLGIVIVDTASKYYRGGLVPVPGFVSKLLSTLKRLAANPKNNVISVCIVGEDDATFGETVSFMGNSRSQAKEKHFSAIPANKAFSLMDLPENLPEFKKYQEQHRNKGIKGSAFIIEALNREAVYSINDLVLKTLGSNGELQPGGESIPGTTLVSNRIFKEWNKKTEPQKLEAGMEAAIKCFGGEDKNRSVALIKSAGNWVKDDQPEVPNKTRIYVSNGQVNEYLGNPRAVATDEYKTPTMTMIQRGDEWIKDDKPEVPNQKRIFITEAQLQKYVKNKHSLGFEAYKEHYSKPLMHTAGEYALFKLKKGIALPSDAHVNVVMEHMAKLHIGGGPVEGPKLDRVKDSPALIDAFAKDLIALEGKIPSDLHENLSKALDQIRDEVKLRQLISASPAVNPPQNAKEMMFYDAREFFLNIKTTIKSKEDADNDLSAKKKNAVTVSEGNTDQATVDPTAVEQVEAQEVVYKGDFLKSDQVIVAETELAPGKILHLEQDKNGKVVDRSSPDLSVSEKQIAALKQAQMLLNNYEPSKGAIVIRGRDKEQAERIYAAVLHFVKNDPEIKKRMESSRWILPSTFSPEKLIRCNIIGFVPPKTIDSGFIAKHLPIIKTLNNEQLEVLNVGKRAEVTKPIMQTNKAIDVVKTQQDYKAHVRQVRQAERPEVEEGIHIPTNTTSQPR